MSKKRPNKASETLLPKEELQPKAEAPKEELQPKAEAPKEELQPKAEAEGEWPEDGYVIAPGKAICCLHQEIKEGGMAIEPADLHKEEDVAADNFDRLLNNGHIIEA